MTTELVAMFDLKRGGHFLDCTVGTGGHSKALLKAGANRILGLDRDEEVLPLAARTLEHWKDHVGLIHSDWRVIVNKIAVNTIRVNMTKKLIIIK